MLKKKDPSDACKLLNGWRNNYSRCSIRTKANDGFAFATVSKDKVEEKKTGKKKKLHVIGARRLGIMPVNVMRNCSVRHQKADLTCL